MGEVTTTRQSDMLFESQLGEHRLVIEGPEAWGGQNRGPAPPQLFMASIGSCVAVLVTHFCDTHGLNAERLSVTVSYDVADHPTRFTNIKVDIHLPDAQCDDECTRRAIRHVAEHCPVHETMAMLEGITFELETA